MNEFVRDASVVLLGVLCLLYLVQLWFAGSHGRELLKDADYAYSDRVSLFKCLRHHDEGSRNNYIFFVLVVILPVFLNSISDLLSLSGDEYPAQRWTYYLCVTTVGVLITLEFSFLHTLRRSAPDWLPILFSALALDLMTLLVLIVVVGIPDEWRSIPGGVTMLVLVMTAVLALASSFLIIVLARASSAVRQDRTIVVRTVEYQKEKSQKQKE